MACVCWCHADEAHQKSGLAAEREIKRRKKRSSGDKKVEGKIS